MSYAFFLGIVVIYTLASIFSLSGGHVIISLKKPMKLNSRLIYTLGYFVSLSGFISLWRLTDYIIKSAKYAFFISLIPFIFFSIIHLKNNIKFSVIFFKTISLMLGLALTIQILCTVFWSRDIYVDAYSTVGSGHSPRYGNITIYMTETDRIPVYGLNYAQSVLSAIPIYFGGQSPLVNLSIWLGLSVFIFINLSYEIFLYFGLPSILAALGTLILSFGNTALSLKHYLVMDTGSPFFMAGYSDTLHSIGILSLIFILFIFIILEKINFIEKTKIATILAFCTYTNTFLAPQNIIVSGVAFGVLLLYSWTSINMPKLTKNYILFLAIILLFSVYLGTFSGGFLTPSQRHEMTTLPGIEKIKSELISPEFSPSIPYHLGNYYGWSMVTNNTKFDEGLRSPKEYIYRLFLVILESFQVIFFPLLGLLLILYLYKTAPKYQLFAIVTFIALTCGLLLVWPMKLYGSKWTLTRFLIPGYFFAQISFCISLFYFFQKLSRKTQILIFGSVAFLMCQGPIKNFTEVLSNNISHSKDLKERLKSMTEYKNIPTK